MSALFTSVVTRLGQRFFLLRFSKQIFHNFWDWRNVPDIAAISIIIIIPLTLQPTVGFGLSNNVLPFFPICHQLSSSSHSQHLKIYFFFLFPSFLGLPLLIVPSSSWVKMFWGILSSSILSRWPNQLILCPFIHFTIFFPSLILLVLG